MCQAMTATSSSKAILEAVERFDSEVWEKAMGPGSSGFAGRQAGSGPLPNLYPDDACGDAKQVGPRRSKSQGALEGTSGSSPLPNRYSDDACGDDKDRGSGSGTMRSSSATKGERDRDEGGRSDEDEGWLLERLADGDRTAFWKLWQLHRSYLFGICAKHSGGINEEAEDVLSRAMLRAFEKMPAYAARINSPKAWLTRLTINLCVDMFRESKRRSSKTTNLDDLAGAEAQPALSKSDSPEEALLRLEIQSQLNGALRELPAQVRGPFLLHFTEEVPCEDVGKAFSITAANVRKRIQRARYLLRQKLEPVGGCRLQ